MKKFLNGSILIAAFILSGCSEDEATPKETKESITDKQIEQEEKPKAVLQLTDAQKEEYYSEYKAIVDQLMQKKLGLHIEVVPKEEFQPNDWVEPKDFQARMDGIEEEHLKEEREVMKAVSSDKDTVTTITNEGYSKSAQTYVTGTVIYVDVIGDFETQLDEGAERQVFSKVNRISSRASDRSKGVWKQTAAQATLLDGGRTYKLHMEGVYEYLGGTYEKAFDVTFNCTPTGMVN